MPDSRLDDLLEQMPRIAEVVNTFESEAVQKQAFETLVAALDGKAAPSRPSDTSPAKTESSASSGKPAPRRRTKAAPKRKGQSVNPGEAVREIDLRPDGKTSFADFVAEKQPKDNQEKYAVVVYWLEHIYELQPITIAHVAAIFRLFREWKEPKDIAKGVEMAGRRKGTVDWSDMNNLATTPTGRNFVDHDLPRQPKAKK